MATVMSSTTMPATMPTMAPMERVLLVRSGSLPDTMTRVESESSMESDKLPRRGEGVPGGEGMK